MPFSRTINNKIIDHFDGKATWSAPAAVYVGFSSTTPTVTGGNVTEPSTGAYARVQVPAASFNSAASSATATNADVVFPTATADWVAGADLTYLVIYDAVTGGNFIGFKELTVHKPVKNGDTAKILSGDLTITLNEV